MGSIHEKNQGPKISCYCTFKDVLVRRSSLLTVASVINSQDNILTYQFKTNFRTFKYKINKLLNLFVIFLSYCTELHTEKLVFWSLNLGICHVWRAYAFPLPTWTDRLSRNIVTRLRTSSNWKIRGCFISFSFDSNSANDEWQSHCNGAIAESLK